MDQGWASCPVTHRVQELRVSGTDDQAGSCHPCMAGIRTFLWPDRVCRLQLFFFEYRIQKPILIACTCRSRELPQPFSVSSIFPPSGISTRTQLSWRCTEMHALAGTDNLDRRSRRTADARPSITVCTMHHRPQPCTPTGVTVASVNFAYNVVLSLIRLVGRACDAARAPYITGWTIGPLESGQ